MSGKKKKKDKRVDLDVRPQVFFPNYDYTDKPADATSPGGGLYMNMRKYKSVADFRQKKEKEMKKRRKMLESFLRLLQLQKLAAPTDDDEKKAPVLDLNQKLIHKKLQQSESQEPTIPSESDELSRRRELKFLSEVEQAPGGGSWMHRFSDVRKDKAGFYILKSDNPAGNQMKVGDLLSDYAVNQTPYWQVASISGDRINLKPIGSNPFLTGVGAGGAKFTDADISVFTGEHERKAIARIEKKLNEGTATIDDVKYLLDGTVALQFGPNGVQGGWYNADDRSSRGGRKGMKPEQIVISDAKKLQSWGFSVPVAALNGAMDASVWTRWIDGNGTMDREEYIPKDVDKYIDFRRKMTEKGKWRYDESDLEKYKRDNSIKLTREYWEQVLADFLELPREEYKAKYGQYFPESVKDIIEWSRNAESEIKKRQAQQDLYLIEGEDGTEASILKNIFHPERRVAIRNTEKLINMAQEDDKYIKYLRDMIKLGGSDWLANEKVLYFFDLIDDIEGLKLGAENLTDPTNQRYALNYLLNQGEKEYVLNKLNKDNDLEVLSSVINNYKNKSEGDEFKIWAAKFINDNNLFSLIEEKTNDPQAYQERFHAGELLHGIITAFRPRWNKEPTLEEKGILDKAVVLLNKIEAFK